VIARTLAGVLTASGDSRFQEISRALSEWTGQVNASDVVPSIYYNLLAQTMYLAMIDELGWPAYEAFNKHSIARNTWEAFVANDTSVWWDNIKSTDKKETRTHVVVRSAERTIDLLKKNAGPEMADWKWEKIHKLKHPHPLGKVAFLDTYFSVGPFGAPGGSEVINNIHFHLDTTGVFHVNGGPALRKITDFGDVENGVTVSPTGQSGNVMSPHYKDQAEMYVRGETRKMMMNRDEILSKSTRLLLKPGMD
jgi:penicillin G amidase